MITLMIFALIVVTVIIPNRAMRLKPLSSPPSCSPASADGVSADAAAAAASAAVSTGTAVRLSFWRHTQVKTTLPNAALFPVAVAAAPAHAAVMRTRTNYGSSSTFLDDDDAYGRRPRRRTQPASFAWKTECKPPYRRTEMSSSCLNSPEALNRIIFDLLCVWHDLKRPSEAVPTSDLGMSDKRETIGKIIFRLTSEIDQRINHLTANAAAPTNFQEFAEEWCLLTWNLISVTTRLRGMEANEEEKGFLFKLNSQLIFLVNKARAIDPPLKENDVTFSAFHDSFATTLHTMHNLYQSLDHIPTALDAHDFAHNVTLFGQHDLYKFLEAFKAYCHVHNTALWHDVRAAQAHRMIDFNKVTRESELSAPGCKASGMSVSTRGVFSPNMTIPCGTSWK
ncbi:hypothetical protein QR680_003223 [Steinernema hermaphroditum]|uniref:NR LBD domain-containing protein n=1 Tax=Steinernema hermaphroditum TaxID=289476 RepID=A0AA39H5V2_9BILA|nr:hypothetical protein QR680_003223 [Steinernema hermaphroditum]